MKVLLVSSNLYSQFPACFPNALGALAPWLRKDGHEVSCLHLFRKADTKQVKRRLEQFQPDVVGISVVTCETRIIEPVAAMAKAWNPLVPVLVGGIHAIVSPESVLELSTIDAVCCGEGELAFAEYLRRLEAGEDVTTVGNFMFRKGGELVRNPPLPFIEDLDSLPLFDREVADLQRVINANNGILNVIFSRGCPWNCQFCCNRHIKKHGTGQYARVVSVPRAM